MKPFTMYSPILIVLLAITINASAQVSSSNSVKFAYDASGNRIERKIILSSGSGERVGNFTKQEPASDNVGNTSIAIYPNPTASSLNITLSNTKESSPVTIFLYDNTGKALITKNNAIGNVELDMSSFAAGHYQLLIVEGTERTNWKIVKE